MWHQTACKISVSVSFFFFCFFFFCFLKWSKNEIDFYCISELMMATLIQRYDKESFHFKNERLTEILLDIRCHICINNFINFSWINKCLFLRNMEPLKVKVAAWTMGVRAHRVFGDNIWMADSILSSFRCSGQVKKK